MRDCGIENSSKLGDIWEWSGGGKCEISNSVSRTGENALCVTRAASDADSVIAQTVTGLKSNAWYVFSAYVNTSEVAVFDSGAVYLTGNGEKSTPLSWNTAGIGDGWGRVYLTVQTDSAGAVTVQAVTSGISGSVYFDDLQLEISLSGENGAPSGCNLLENGSMHGSGGWNFSAPSDVEYASDAMFGRAIRCTGTISGEVYARQTVMLNQPGTQTYVFAAWAKGDSVPLLPDESRKFGLHATLYYQDGTEETHDSQFTSEAASWQYNVLPIVTKEPDKTVARIDVEYRYDYNANTSYFANAALVKEDAASYKYNADGNLVSVMSSGNAPQSYSYSGADLIGQVTKGSGEYTYGYDTKHNLTSVTNDGVTMTLTPDAVGNTTGTKLTADGTDLFMYSAAEYTNGGNLLSTATDSRGNKTLYAYESSISRMLGLPTSVTDANGVTADTVYDAKNGRTLRTGIEGIAQIAYAYTAGRISELTRTGRKPGGAEKQQTYALGYTPFGQLGHISVGDRLLASYLYSDAGLLQTMTYGNGDSVKYVYDPLARVRSVCYNGSDEPAVEYSYNGEGRLSYVKDNMAGWEYSYHYDMLGRLISMTVPGVQMAHTRYDTANRTSTAEYRVSPMWNGAYGDIRRYGYTYDADDGSLSAMTAPVSGEEAKFTYTYDALKRLSSRAMALPGGLVLSYHYEYLPGSEADSTTSLVKTLTTKLGDTVISTLTYDYDKNGNIISVSGSENAQYTYDEQGQLLSETSDGVTNTFTYDTCGNLLTKRGETGAHTYTYGDAAWGDLLTAFNGHPLSYDEIGDPTSWFDGSTFTWENGRQLVSWRGTGFMCPTPTMLTDCG